MAIDKVGKAKVKMYLYMQVMTEAVNPAIPHAPEVLFARVGVLDITYFREKRDDRG